MEVDAKNTKPSFKNYSLEKKFFTMIKYAHLIYDENFSSNPNMKIKLGVVEATILDNIIDRIEKFEKVELTKIELLFVLNFVDYINKFIIEFTPNIQDKSNKTFFRLSEEFFAKYNEFEDFMSKWKEYRKFIKTSYQNLR